MTAVTAPDFESIDLPQEVGVAIARPPIDDSVVVVDATHMPMREGTAFAPDCGADVVAAAISVGTSTVRLWSTPQAVASAAATTNVHTLEKLCMVVLTYLSAH